MDIPIYSREESAFSIAPISHLMSEQHGEFSYSHQHNYSSESVPTCVLDHCNLE